MDFLRNLIQIPSSVSVSMKLPKFKKLRQWSHDSIVNLSQLTIRSTNNTNTKQKQQFENPLPTTGITTISSAIHEQQIDPKKDNFGLYALKCDRSRSLANARRGILLNLPSTKIKYPAPKIETNNFQSIERNHEVFKSCEILIDNDNDNANENEIPRKLDTTKLKIEPPPRKKKRALAPHLNALHHKPKQIVYQQQVNKANIQNTTMSMDSLEKNDSGLYKIVGSTETAKITYVEPKKKERIVAIVKPKIEKAVTVKSTPMPRQIANVKSYDMNRVNQRRGNRGSLKKVEAKKYTKSKSLEATKSTTDSIDIFKSNRIMDQKKLFDEFDELFEKNKAWEEKKEITKDDQNQSPEIAFEKLKELKKHSSSSISLVSGNEDMNNKEVTKNSDIVDNNVMSQINVYDKNLARAKYVNSLLQDDGDDIDLNFQIAEITKPKIISEQVKQHGEVSKKKILYYDDESELQDMIMRRTQTNAMKSSLSMDVKDIDTNQILISENKRHTQSISNSNSLKIFSNEGDKIFVFNL